MEKNPYNEEINEAAEHLRLTLALLSKHQIPLSPLNYRLGYDFLLGANKTLVNAFKNIIDQPGKPSQDTLWELYNRSYSVSNHDPLNQIREELKNIIITMQEEFNRSGTSLASFTARLDHFATALNSSSSTEVMAAKVSDVIEDTRATEQSQRLVQSQLSHISNEMEALRKELGRVRQEAMTDSLTGIPNRKAFDNALEKAIYMARTHKQPYSLLLLDIDHFKKINDTYGHLVGDKVLRFVANSLKRSIKGKDMSARIGGEEFAIILPETNIAEAYIVAEQVRRTVSAGTLKDTDSNEEYGSVTISIGIGQFNDNELLVDLMKRTDKALYAAKEAGRDRVKKATYG